MTSRELIEEYIGRERLERAEEEARRRRISTALNVELPPAIEGRDLRSAWLALELSVFDLLESEDRDTLRQTALDAFQIGRALSAPEDPLHRIEFLLRLSCYGTLADRCSDVSRIVKNEGVSSDLLGADDWGLRVQAAVYDIWLRLLRKSGWDDLDAVLEQVRRLRQDQSTFEPDLLRRAAEQQDQSPAWALMARYHLSKAAEMMGVFLCSGQVDGTFDIREQLEGQFDRAILTSAKARDMELENMSRLLARTARVLVESSIWTVTRSVNSRVTDFVKQVTSKARSAPIFTVLAPQREVLLREGLLGSSHRAVVVSLPTSSGKTFIAQFRILQALNQFDKDKGWVTYLAPTRALVNQITLKLRRDFGPLGVNVEKVSPALELDGLEAGLLTDNTEESQFRVLVTTPEKLDLMLRGGWEQKIGRPLTLVVVDEAHNLASDSRGLKLELLLATINRECQFAQFLLLTPFVPNADEISRWLSPDSNRSMSLSVEWSPNDRIIGIAHRRREAGVRGGYRIELETVHASKASMSVAELIEFPQSRPLGLSWSAAASPGKLASAVAHMLSDRGTIIVLATQPDHTWGIAEALRSAGGAIEVDEDVEHVARYLSEELGDGFPLLSLIKAGVAVHHSGLSEDTRVLVEWLTERGSLRTLVATTTIAQGLNFPVSGVVFASHQYPYGEDMPSEDFWNIAGRAGRIGQSDLGVVALVAPDEGKAIRLRAYVQNATGRLNSTLIEMVQQAVQEHGSVPELGMLSVSPEWSAFLQYLAHSYRLIGDHARFANQIENVLRGTLGFQGLRRSHPSLAVQLVERVQGYANKMQGKPLELVDTTGFSLESVMGTLGRVSEQGLAADVWTTDLFGASGEAHLRTMMGLLLQVPELRDNLMEVGNTGNNPSDRLARIVTDWVQGKPLTSIAEAHFPVRNDSADELTKSMTSCCKMIYSKLAQTASWGISALQSLTLKDSLEQQPEDVARKIRNLPSWVYYGVNSDEAMAVRMLGVPRTAAAAMAAEISVSASDPISLVRQKLRTAPKDAWVSALGDRGETYYRVWQIMEGEV